MAYATVVRPVGRFSGFGAAPSSSGIPAVDYGTVLSNGASGRLPDGTVVTAPPGKTWTAGYIVEVVPSAYPEFAQYVQRPATPPVVTMQPAVNGSNIVAPIIPPIAPTQEQVRMVASTPTAGGNYTPTAAESGAVDAWIIANGYGTRGVSWTLQDSDGYRVAVVTDTNKTVTFGFGDGVLANFSRVSSRTMRAPLAVTDAVGVPAARVIMRAPIVPPYAPSMISVQTSPAAVAVTQMQDMNDSIQSAVLRKQQMILNASGQRNDDASTIVPPTPTQPTAILTAQGVLPLTARAAAAATREFAQMDNNVNANNLAASATAPTPAEARAAAALGTGQPNANVVAQADAAVAATKLSPVMLALLVGGLYFLTRKR